MSNQLTPIPNSCYFLYHEGYPATHVPFSTPLTPNTVGPWVVPSYPSTYNPQHPEPLGTYIGSIHPWCQSGCVQAFIWTKIPNWTKGVECNQQPLWRVQCPRMDDSDRTSQGYGEYPRHLQGVVTSKDISKGVVGIKQVLTCLLVRHWPPDTQLMILLDHE